MADPIDLSTRIAATPPDAAIRVRYLMMLEDPLREAGLDPALVRTTRPIPPYGMVSVREFLPLAHAAGSAIGPTPEQGLARLYENAFPYLLELPSTRMFVSPRERDPFSLLARFAQSRSLIASYGEWEIDGAPGDATLTLRKEWVWIEELWCPVLLSVFTACRAPKPSLEQTLLDPWSATLRFRW